MNEERIEKPLVGWVRRLNRKQRIVLWCVHGLIVIMCLYVPWYQPEMAERHSPFLDTDAMLDGRRKANRMAAKARANATQQMYERAQEKDDPREKQWTLDWIDQQRQRNIEAEQRDAAELDELARRARQRWADCGYAWLFLLEGRQRLDARRFGVQVGVVLFVAAGLMVAFRNRVS